MTKTGSLVPLALLGLALVLGGCEPPPTNQTNKATKSTVATTAPTKTTPQSISPDWEKGVDHTGEVVRWVGVAEVIRITDIRDGSGEDFQSIITVRTGPEETFDAYFDKDSRADLAKIPVGASVTIKGMVNHAKATTRLQSCIVEEWKPGKL